MAKRKKSGLSCVLLAAGLGTRMKSSLPKVLHPILGRPMVHYCLESIKALHPEKAVVVVGREGDPVIGSVRQVFDADFAMQKKRLGTAHALRVALPVLEGFNGTVLVMNGDTPLVTARTLKSFLGLHRKHGNAVSVLSFRASDPSSYGRIVRDASGRPLRIVEQKDATPAEREVNEVNSGVYAIEASALPVLGSIRLNRKKSEYYLTDVLEIANRKGYRTGVYMLGNEEEFLGVNTRVDLARAQESLRSRLLRSHVENNVFIMDPRTTFIEPGVRIGRDSVIYPNVYIQGSSVIGRECIIYPNVRISDSRIMKGAVIKDSTLIEGSTVGAKAHVGPFAHLRNGSSIGDSAKIGNFVEVKKTSVGRGSKAMHLSYLGDAVIGGKVNVGAGTITCNYDGKTKHKTVIEDGAFIGSDTQLVAPVKVGRGSYVGAGSTITSDVPPGSLAVSRAAQKNIKGWSRKKK